MCEDVAAVTPDAEKNPHRIPARRLTIVALLSALAAGCGPLHELINPAAPAVAQEWAGLLNELRAFERTQGFVTTANFAALAKEQGEFAFCGHASRLALPYSYEDPAITWLDVKTEQECREYSQDTDMYFGELEATGENATPVTPAMIAGKLDRFIYLVIHEDCHDQFELPHGIEEALCNLIAYKGMAAFTAEKYGMYSREQRAVQRYVDARSRVTRLTIAYYGQLAELYARYERGEIPSDALLRERAAILQAAAQPLAWTQGEINNVRIANHMTYSRHYPFLDNVFDALGRDTARTVAFFKRVDAIKPSHAAVMARNGIVDDDSVEAIRAYEAAVIATISAALAAELGGADTGHR